MTPSQATNPQNKYTVWRNQYILNSRKNNFNRDKIVSNRKFSQDSSKEKPRKQKQQQQVQPPQKRQIRRRGLKTLKSPYTYQINDRVKISTAKTPFTREYSEKFSTETFFVQRRKVRNGIPMYTLRDELGEIIQGQFYEREMTPVIVPDDKQYKIERIVSSKRIKGKKHVLVKWQNFPKKYNSYIPEEDLVNIKN